MAERILLGDCIETMLQIKPGSVDMLFTDLPYGTTNCKWDTPICLSEFWKAANMVVKPGGAKVLFGQSPFDKVLAVSNLKEFRYEWIWEKTEATGHLNAEKMPLKAHENILIFYDRLPTYNPQMTHGHKRKVSTAQHRRNSRHGEVYGEYGNVTYDSTDRYPRDVLRGPTDKRRINLHPTQKPVALMKTLIELTTQKGQLVIDPFSGSGSTLVAAKDLGRDYIGFEINPTYVETSIKRLNK